MEKEILIPAEVAKLPEVLDFMEEELTEQGCPARLMNRILIAVEEIFLNIADYAYSHKDGVVTMVISKEEELLSITFKDSGTPFNPLEKADPKLELELEERNEGGLGIFMVRNMMDEVTYRYENGMNILTIRKKLIEG